MPTITLPHFATPRWTARERAARRDELAYEMGYDVDTLVVGVLLRPPPRVVRRLGRPRLLVGTAALVDQRSATGDELERTGARMGLA